MSGYCAFATMNKNELREISIRGGIASGAARREKRRRIDELKLQDRARLEAILDGTRFLKQIYRGMTEEEREQMWREQASWRPS